MRSARSWASCWLLMMVVPGACEPGLDEEVLVSLPSIDRTSDLVETRRMGLDPDGAAFVSIRDVAIGADGSLYVLEGGLRQVLHFGADWELINSIGGQGDGPGEFREASALAVSSDTVFVFDTWSARITTFGVDGSLMETRAVEPIPRVGSPPEAWRHRSGDWIYVNYGPPDPASLEGGQVVRETADVVRLPAGSDSWTEVEAFPGNEIAVFTGPEGRLIARPAPFGNGPMWASSEPDLVWYADSERYRVVELRSSGEIRRTIVAQVEPLIVTAEDRASYLDAGEPALAAERRAVPMPDHRPVLHGLVADDRGRVWVGAYGTDDDTTAWHVYDADGTPSFFLHLPRMFDLRLVNGDTLLAVGRDSMDVQFLQEFVLRAPD